VADSPRPTPKDNETSKSLIQKANTDREALAKLDGSAFDKAYVDNEVAYHRMVDGALKTALIPGAANPELKALLGTGLKIFKGHEQHAEHLAASLK
jgi:putative membrane protein